MEVFFEDFFHWLGYLFNWGDIQRTAEVIKASLNVSLDFAVVAIKYVRKRVERGFDTVEQRIGQLLESELTHPPP